MNDVFFVSRIIFLFLGMFSMIFSGIMDDDVKADRFIKFSFACALTVIAMSTFKG